MWPIPKQTSYSIKENMEGWPVWSLQAGLRNLGKSVAVDGDFGPQTLAIVKDYQSKFVLTTDGIAGPVTQKSILTQLIPGASFDLPNGLMMGFCASEGGWLFGAVNWGTPGGVDCGIIQRRVYERDYENFSVISRAFDSSYQMVELARTLQEQRNLYATRSAVNKNRTLVWRLAALYHNYPLAADTISKVGFTGLSSYWNSPASWVLAVGARFSNGDPVKTPLQWCQFYALGSEARQHKGVVTQYVDWSKI
jgi:peptidoglycan hydrolase-like protein with peptidoglycan-binding domain